MFRFFPKKIMHVIRGAPYYLLASGERTRKSIFMLLAVG